MQSLLFLRPELLLLFLPLLIVVWFLYKRQNDEANLSKIVESHLLKHLLLKPQNRQGSKKIFWLLPLTLSLMIISLSGPSWSLKSSLTKQNETEIASIIKVTQSMESADLRPSRLKRGVFKLKDLFALQSDMHSLLIAYSGSAHLVMPMSKDTEIIYSFADALSTSLMPQEGDTLYEALRLADKQLPSTATIIVFCDGVASEQIALLKKDASLKEKGVIFYAIGSKELLDLVSIQKAADAINAQVVLYTPDKSDVLELEDKIAFHFQSANAQDVKNRQDDGYTLLPLIFLMMALLFRRGVAMQIWKIR